ncbi:SDR family NAD(P)-dependent oxidoreductase [Uliginosibacterium sp. 31-16]|uniref:SDR family NAD(P)-dependent oxidoreductase n=1 Tax=Uliginosibacterium sp. 31-16 TaxID=3068315 RepID=UPI00273F7C56|nr:SDR family NAD(P)-dependent oxidoreductase [Uliginosibacterium sp. 31-16]MDP5238642.1 SDR family NAD(P)-dependent oxidoreductase [Uliginosibacterium sp. 31-16]
MSKTVLVAGASRGIGLEFAVQYAAEGWHVVAGCRAPEQARRWTPAGVDLQTLDVTNANSIAALGWHLDDAPLDLLIVNAGVSGPDTGSFAAPGDDAFDTVMHTNVLGPMRLIQAFGTNVARAGGVIAVMSSKMGSIYETTGADALAYRASKAAANMVMKAAANEFGPQGATIVSLHPGWVRTDMGGPNAQVGVSESVEGLRKVIAELSADDNGCFLDYTGRNLSW